MRDQPDQLVTFGDRNYIKLRLHSTHRAHAVHQQGFHVRFDFIQNFWPFRTTSSQVSRERSDSVAPAGLG